MMTPHMSPQVERSERFSIANSSPNQRCLLLTILFCRFVFMVDCSSIGGVIILRVDQIDGLRTVDEFRLTFLCG